MCIRDRFRNETLPVIHVQHLATRPTATFFLPGTKGAQIHNSVKPLDTEKVIVKHYPNSFRETELLEYLTKNDITDLVICGMMTHMCIDATVRAAKDFGFSITIPGDACATKDLDVNGQIVRADQVQTSFLAALNYFYASVTTTVEYLSSMAT
jgi:nicotinamidase-related amidase